MGLFQKIKKQRITLLFALAVALSTNVANAVPKRIGSPLPFEDKLEEEMVKTEYGKEAIAFILSLNIFQDHKDHQLYYYSPPFTMSSNRGGAATVITNDRAISISSQIDRISERNYDITVQDFYSLNQAYNNLTKRLSDKSLTEEMIDAINLSRASIKKEADELRKAAREHEQSLPKYIVKASNERIADLFGFLGFSISKNEIEDMTTRSRKLADISVSNGGIFSGNVTSGFASTKEIGYIVFYKSERARLKLPQVNIVLLPVENLEFYSLAETYLNTKNKETVGAPLFRDMKGSGNVKGGTFNFDLTLSGAMQFASAPPPIIPPFGIKAKLLVRPEKFSVKLSCDFTNGWEMKGRTDVKDGLIIYNNDIFSNMIAKDVNQVNKPCTFEVVGGGTDEIKEKAYIESMLHLMEKFDHLFLERASLAPKERIAYWDKVQQDIASNRHTGANKDGIKERVETHRSGGFLGLFSHSHTTVVREIPQLYWYTNSQNIKSLSKIKFEKTITIDQNKEYTVDLPTHNLCLAFNAKTKTYVACDEKESFSAISMNDAFKEATHSEVCNDNDTVTECRDKRIENAEKNENGNMAPDSNRVDLLPERF